VNPEPRPERMLQRRAIEVEIRGAAVVITLECDHLIRCPDMTLTEAYQIRRSIEIGRPRVYICQKCDETPRPGR
jgi:hypothetical protein